jgi:hypothetical protein
MLAPPRGTAGERLGQVQKHIRFQFQPHGTPVLGSGLCSRNQFDNLPTSLGMVANRRRSGFSSGVVASTHHHHQHFLVYVNSCYLVGHGFLLAWKRQNAREETLHTVTCYYPSRQDG